METVRLNLKLDRETHRSLKMLAVQVGQTMQAIVADLIRQRVKTAK